MKRKLKLTPPTAGSRFPVIRSPRGKLYFLPVPTFGSARPRTVYRSSGTGAGHRECAPMTTRLFTLARLGRRREAFLNPRLPERCLAVDGPGRLIAVEVEV